jgi:hypothetical protein
MENYGFAMLKNKFNSLLFRVKTTLNPKIGLEDPSVCLVKITDSQILEDDNLEVISIEINLKLDKLCPELMTYIRDLMDL